MADIRQELQSRLAGIEARRETENQRHEASRQALDREAEIVKAMLALEEGRPLKGTEAMAPIARPLRPGAGNVIESEILDALSNHQDWDHHDIKAYLIERGTGSESDPQFGRSVHGKLLSMRNRELVEGLGDGKWRIAKKGLAGA